MQQLAFPFPVEAPNLTFAERNRLRGELTHALERRDLGAFIYALDRLRGFRTEKQAA